MFAEAFNLFFQCQVIASMGSGSDTNGPGLKLGSLPVIPAFAGTPRSFEPRRRSNGLTSTERYRAARVRRAMTSAGA